MPDILCSGVALTDSVAVPVVLDLSARASSLAGRSRKVCSEQARDASFMDTCDSVGSGVSAVAGGPCCPDVVGGDPTARTPDNHLFKKSIESIVKRDVFRIVRIVRTVSVVAVGRYIKDTEVESVSKSMRTQPVTDHVEAFHRSIRVSGREQSLVFSSFGRCASVSPAASGRPLRLRTAHPR